MSELLSATIPADVGQALLAGTALLLVGLLGVVAGAATERGKLRRILDDVFTDPDLAKTIFVAQWSVDAPAGVIEHVDAVWHDSEHVRAESTAAARAVHQVVTAELDL
jgi:hypothetical protein